MKRTSLLCLLGLLSPTLLLAGRVAEGFGQLKKKNFPQAAKLFSKELSKNPTNAGAKYGYALYFFDEANPRRHVDSSYQYVLAALLDYPQTPPKVRKGWEKLHINDSTMRELKVRLDSLAFAAALDSNQLDPFQTFIDKHPTATQRMDAIRHRNELAFAEARRLNTYESYKRFLEQYPEAPQVKEVTEISQLVLYESETRDGRPESYLRFSTAHPRSPYRTKADQMAFALLTAPHTLEKYHAFARQHPQNACAPRAWTWMLYLYSQQKNLNDFLSDYPDYPDQTHLQKLLQAQSLAYFPVYEEDRYGFLDSDGTLRIPITYDSTANDYFCEGIKDDFILAYQRGKLGALDKTGKVIADFAYDAIEELERPLLLVTREGKRGVVHEGGFEVLPAEYDSVEILNDFFLKTTRHGKQGLATMNGLVVFEPAFEEITGLGTAFVRIRQQGRYALLGNVQLFPTNGRVQIPTPVFRYQRAEWVKPTFARVWVDSAEAIVDGQLRIVIPPQRQPIGVLPTAWSTQDSTGVRLWSLDGQPILDSTGRALAFEHVTANDHYFAVKYRGQWGVLDKAGKTFLSCAYDSLAPVGENMFVLTKKKNTWLRTATGKLLSVPEIKGVRPQAIDPDRPPDAAPTYLTLEARAGKQGLFTATGKQLLPFWYESIRVLGANLFLVEAEQPSGHRKVALKDSLNQLLLPLLYDGLSPMRKGFVATLKGTKFGVFSPGGRVATPTAAQASAPSKASVARQNKAPKGKAKAKAGGTNIPPQYESLLQLYDNEGTLFIARKNGKLGLIDRNNQTKAPFQFEDLRYWLHSVALVKENGQWRLYDFTNKLYFMQPFDDISYIQNQESEIVIKVYTNRRYGVLSSVRGQIIPAEYDDLGNAGDERVPFYVAEKHVDTAGVYLLFYFDQNGKLLRKQLFNEAVYEKIVCE